jgi:hypothetical protein
MYYPHSGQRTRTILPSHVRVMESSILVCIRSFTWLNQITLRMIGRGGWTANPSHTKTTRNFVPLTRVYAGGVLASGEDVGNLALSNGYSAKKQLSELSQLKRGSSSNADLGVTVVSCECHVLDWLRAGRPGFDFKYRQKVWSSPLRPQRFCSPPNGSGDLCPE